MPRKLDENQVREIKRRLAAGNRQVDIAEDFGVTQEMISRIKTGARWKNVQEEQ